jgi:RNA recognition motif-containing protein
VRIEDNKFYPPGLDENERDKWQSNKVQYFCVFPKQTNASGAVDQLTKPSIDEVPETNQQSSSSAPSSGGAQPKTIDLIVLNLSSNTTENDLKEYFETDFGPLLMNELKRDRKTGNSRRFAFIRFKNYKDQMKALGHAKHKIDNQQIKLALPDFRDPSELYMENKCFIGRVNETLKPSDLQEFFSQFGEIVEISCPKKFKGYAFITFADVEVARKVCGQDFIVKGYSLCVSKSTRKDNQQPQQKQQQQQPMRNNQNYPQTQIWEDGWFPGNNNSSNYAIQAPISSNYFANQMLSSQVNPMNNMNVNALALAMSNLMNKPVSDKF